MLLEVLEEDLLQDVRTALSEDIGSGDITAALVPDEETVMATVISRDTAVLCGMAWFNAVFAELDTGIQVDWQARDGETISPDQVLCTLAGNAAPILTGERTALNFLQTLSGTATLARQYADAVSGLPVRILDTRKTIPGLRQAQKYAVRTGGCHNHRMGLFDAILIKENHIAAAGSIAAAVAAARTSSPGSPVELEVENPGQLAAALAAGADSLLLDNFTTAELSDAVTQVAGRIPLEASGGVSLVNVRDIALTGVDSISVGELTKNVHAVDFSMLFRNLARP
ncbi:MAG: carboxylating nicotinate-nucleotide diphosphorylase [Gammaproteobacteria bacterium]|nr:MAG: carboxylating nicotinate-nucleotide diphosphorylase [Gammaproteobacteria bacterium]